MDPGGCSFVKAAILRLRAFWAARSLRLRTSANCVAHAGIPKL